MKAPGAAELGGVVVFICSWFLARARACRRQLLPFMCAYRAEFIVWKYPELVSRFNCLECGGRSGEGCCRKPCSVHVKMGTAVHMTGMRMTAVVSGTGMVVLVNEFGSGRNLVVSSNGGNGNDRESGINGNDYLCIGIKRMAKMV